MKRFMTSLLALMLIVGLSGCEDDVPKTSPVKIDTKIHNQSFAGMNMKIPQITITAVADVTIKDVIINEGNGCPVSVSRPSLPKTMKYGERIIRTYTAQCNVMKVDVITDKGNWSAEYE